MARSDFRSLQTHHNRCIGSAPDGKCVRWRATGGCTHTHTHTHSLNISVHALASGVCGQAYRASICASSGGTQPPDATLFLEVLGSQRCLACTAQGVPLAGCLWCTQYRHTESPSLSHPSPAMVESTAEVLVFFEANTRKGHPRHYEEWVHPAADLYTLTPTDST